MTSRQWESWQLWRSAFLVVLAQEGRNNSRTWSASVDAAVRTAEISVQAARGMLDAIPDVEPK